MNACEEMLGLFTIGLAAIGALSIAMVAVGGVIVCTCTIPDLLRPHV